MIKEAKGFGETIDEAKEQAIANLNAPLDADIQFEVIATPKKKALGLFGGRKAEVRVFVELPEPKATGKKASAKPQKKETPQKNQPKKPQPEKAVVKEQPKKAAPSDQPEYGEPVDASALPEDSKESRAVAYLRNVLEKLGCNNLSIRVASKENGAMILLDGENINVVIGRRGETLDSLQYLTSLAANRGGGYFKITINIGNYREKREETLTALAGRMAAQVLKTGKSRSLEPMNPYERRIIHTAVQEIDGVYSTSFGEGAGRRVIITPDGQEPVIPRRDDHRRGRSSSRRRPSSHGSSAQTQSPSREPRKDSDTPLYGKIL